MLDELLERVAGRFGRVEPRRRIRSFVLGLLADLPRKNCWSIAEHAGDATPDGMQYLLERAVWDTDGVRDDLRDYVVEHFGDPAAVLVVDETGDVKKGNCTVGTQRERTEHPPPGDLIALTCNEIRHLFTRLITEPTRRITDPLAWSRWRRHHQHRARASHYHRQETQLT